MGTCPEYLVTGAGGAIGGVSTSVVELLVSSGASVRAMVHRDGEPAADLRAIGADVVVGDLTRPEDVVPAMRGVTRVFFNMGVSATYLTAAAVVAAAGRDHGALETVVDMSQMTISQMTLTSTEESNQHRLHWLAEQVLDWSGLPVTHVRPTVFMDNPLFTFLNADSVRDRHVLALPFGHGRTSPVAAADVAAVVATLLREPGEHCKHVYELTGPEVLDIDDLAERYSRAVGFTVTGTDVSYERWRDDVLAAVGLPAHVEQHIATMAALHRAGRYDRLTHDVERVTGRPATTLEQYVGDNLGKFVG